MMGIIQNRPRASRTRERTKNALYRQIDIRTDRQTDGQRYVWSI